jgi:hypothetical protein
MAKVFLSTKAKYIPNFLYGLLPLAPVRILYLLTFLIAHHRLVHRHSLSFTLFSLHGTLLKMPSKGALWFVWPVIDDSWKITVGIKADPQAAKAAAAATAPSKASQEQSTLAKLPLLALKQTEDALEAHARHVEMDEDKLLAKVAKTGDFTHLEEL